MKATERFAKLDQLRDRTSVSGTERDRIRNIVERLAAQAGGLVALVERYADTVNPVLANSIAFQLAGAAVPENPADVSPSVLDMIARLRTSDTAIRTNLLTALQRLLMRDRVPTPLPPQVIPFLLAALEHEDMAREVVADVVGVLHAHDGFIGADPAQMAELRARLWALSGTSDPQLAPFIRDLDDYFLDTARTPYPVSDAAPTELLFAELARPTSYDQAWAIMSAVATREAGLAALVERFARSVDLPVIRTLTLVLARAARDEAAHHTLAPLVWCMMDVLHTDDAKTHLNLIEALIALLRSAPPAFADKAPPPLVSFLLADLAHDDGRIRIAAARAVSTLDAYDYLPLFTRTQLDALRASVLAAKARATDDDILRRFDRILAALG